MERILKELKLFENIVGSKRQKEILDSNLELT
jgi:hypothetical protein